LGLRLMDVQHVAVVTHALTQSYATAPWLTRTVIVCDDTVGILGLTVREVPGPILLPGQHRRPRGGLSANGMAPGAPGGVSRLTPHPPGRT
jgi:hypothetical protein